MNKKEIGKEIETLIRSIKLHYDNIAEEVRIPTIELELITAKIRKLHEKSIVFNHLHMIEEQMNKMKRLEKELNNPDDDESPEENFIINANEISTPLAAGARIPAEPSAASSPAAVTHEPIAAPAVAPVIEATPAPEPEPIAIAEEPVATPVVEEIKPVVNVEVAPPTIALEPVIAPVAEEVKTETSNITETTELVGKDLKKIIGFSDKYFFISQLFAGNADQFNAEINAMNKMTSLTSAQTHLETLTQAKGWNRDAEAFQSLTRYIQNKFN